MKRFILLLGLLLASAQAAALSLEEALAMALTRPNVLNAERDLADAQEALARTRLDPLALRLEHLQAEQRLELAEARLRQARFEAEQELAEAYLQLVEAEAQLELAREALSLSEQARRITEIRVENGSATMLELREAELGVQEAANAVAAAEEGRAIAAENLRGLLGEAPEQLEPPTAPTLSLPPFSALQAKLDTLPALLEASHGLALSALALELLDPSYAPRVEIDAARSQREQTERLLHEARRGLELQLRSLHTQLKLALENHRTAQEALANAQARTAVERQRFEAGLIAEIALHQAELELRRTHFEAMQAVHDLLRAAFALQSGSAQALEGLRAP
jgi:outer membrane protein TolC